MHQVDFFQHARGFAVPGDGRRGEFFEDAVAEGGGAAAPAGEEEDEQQVVIVLTVVAEDLFEAVAAFAVDMVDGGKRLVLHAAAGGKQEGKEEGGEGFHGLRSIPPHATRLLRAASLLRNRPPAVALH